jgi:hypothetical protein
MRSQQPFPKAALLPPPEQHPAEGQLSDAKAQPSLASPLIYLKLLRLQIL